MSGAEPEVEAREQDNPEDAMGPDPDLIDEDEVEDDPGPVRKPKSRKKRGKRGDPDIAKAKQRPFVESQVRQSLAKSDITETMNRWDWESSDYEVAVKRVQPQSFQGRNTYGFIASFPHAIDEVFIQDNFGGGVYDLTVRGPHPKSGAKRSFLDGCRVKVAGPPRLSPMDSSLQSGGSVVLPEPSPEMGAMTRQQKAQSAGGWTTGSQGNGGGSDRGMERMAFDAITSQAKQDRAEVSRLQTRLLDQAAKPSEVKPPPPPPPPDTSLQRETLKLARDSMDKVAESERAASEKFERIVDKIGSQQQGIPPELLQSLSEQHRSEMTTQATSFQTQLSSERERFDREMGSLRDRSEREIDQTRGSLQERVDRAQDESKRETERVREESARRLEDTRRDSDRALQLERERSERDHQSERDRSDRDRTSAEASHKMQVEHMKALHDGQVSQLTSTQQAQLTQLTGQHETSMKMAEASLEARILSLQSELDRTRSDLTSANTKIGEQGDLVQQATKLKTVSEALGGAFGLGAIGGGVGGGGGGVPVPSAPAEPEMKGWLGTLMKFADSRLGENMFDFIKVAAAQAAGMGPAIPSLPGQMPPGYGVPSQYGGQPAYPQTPPGYAPPQYGGVPVHATPIDDEEYGEEEYGEDEDVVNGTAEGVETEAAEDEEQSEPQPQEPVVTSEVDDDGVVRGNVPYGRPIGANAPPPAPKPKAKPRPKTPQQPQMPQMTQEEAAEQARALVAGVEEAMSDNTPPDQLAQLIVKVAPPDQLTPFATVPLAELVDKMVQIVPDTMLATFSGRQYLGALQTSLRAVLGIPAS